MSLGEGLVQKGIVLPVGRMGLDLRQMYMKKKDVGQRDLSGCVMTKIVVMKKI